MDLMWFRNLIFHKGVNCTVRPGVDYWRTRLKIGKPFALCRSSQTYGHGQFIPSIIEHWKVKQFKDICPEDIHAEHDPNCRDWDGLLSDMLSAYPDFSSDDEVILIYFSVPFDINSNTGIVPDKAKSEKIEKEEKMFKFKFKHYEPRRGGRLPRFGEPTAIFNKTQITLNDKVMALPEFKNATRIHPMIDDEQHVVAFIPGGDNLPKSVKLMSIKSSPCGRFSSTGFLKQNPIVRQWLAQKGKVAYPLVKVRFEITGLYEGMPVYVIFLQ